MATPPLSLEQYAVAGAHVAHFTHHEMKAVLQHLGVGAQAWRSSSDHWLGALQGEFDDDDAPVAMAYGAAFSSAKAKLDGEKPRLEDVPPLLDPNAMNVTSLGGVPAVDDPYLPFRGVSMMPPPLLDPMEVTTDQMGMTTTVAALDVADEALPFAAAPTLSLTQYASLQAELAGKPAERQAILLRYGVRDQEMLRTIDMTWSRRLVANAEERRQYDELVRNYSAWLGTGGTR
jgi:hypothetical protein